MNKTIILIVCAYILGFYTGIMATKDHAIKQQVRADELQKENYYLLHKKPRITDRQKAEIKWEGSGKFFAECVAWELKNK